MNRLGSGPDWRSEEPDIVGDPRGFSVGLSFLQESVALCWRYPDS